MQNTTKTKSNKAKYINRYYWRISGIILWFWIFNAIISQFNLALFIEIKNIYLSLLIIGPLYYIFNKKPFKIIQFIGYLAIFPFWLPILAIKLISFIIKIIISFFTLINKCIDYSTRTLSTFVSLILFLIIQILVIRIDNFRIQYLFIVLNSIIMLLFTISVLKWAHDPFQPIKSFQSILINLGNKFKKFYHEKIIIRTVMKKNYDKIQRELESLQKYEEAILNLEGINLESNVNLRQNLAIVSIVVFFLLITVITFGYGANILCLNRITTNQIDQTAQINIENPPLFETLPVNSNYLSCVFHSFTIMTTSQDFNLSNTSLAGKIIVITEIMLIFFIFTMILSLFFTNLSSNESPTLLTIEKVRNSSKSTISEWRSQLESSIKPSSLNSTENE